MQTNRGMPLRRTWSASDRCVPRAMVPPVQRLLRHEASGGPGPEAAAPPGERLEPRPEPALTAS